MYAGEEIWQGSASWKAVLASWKSWLTLGLYGFLFRRGSRYKITDEQVYARYEMFGRKTDIIDVQDLEDIRVSQSALGQALGVGHLTFRSAGPDETTVEFKYVSDPDDVKADAEAAKQQAEAPA